MKRIKEIIAKEIEAISSIPLDNSIELAVDEIYDKIHDVNRTIRGKVIISGMGKAGHIGYNIAMTLSSTGTPAV